MQRLREKLEEIEADIVANRIQMDERTATQVWLAEQRSECMKAIARLTLAREK